jgi:hypothetical protein
VTIKQKLQAIQQKYSVSEDEAKDLLNELEQDYNKADLADKWNDWYSENKAIIDANAARAGQADQLESELARIRQTVSPGDERRQVTNEQPHNADPSFNPQQFASNLFKGASDLVKHVNVITTQHYMKFGEVPDLDEIEKIVNSRGLNFVEAYKVWAEPKEKEKFETDLKAKYEKEFAEKLEQEKSKLKFPSNTPRANSNSAVRALLEKKEVNESDLMDDFIKDLNTPVSKTGSA